MIPKNPLYKTPTPGFTAPVIAYIRDLLKKFGLKEILTNSNDGNGLQIKNIGDGTLPQDAVTLSQISGGYVPTSRNLTINGVTQNLSADRTYNVGIVTSISAGTAISIGGTAAVPIVTNTAPDQTVVLTNGTGISITGTYPNFTITNTSPSSGGTVTSVTGTANRITSSGGTTPAIDISAAYVGQTSITTLGTIATGTWNGTVVASTYGGADAWVDYSATSTIVGWSSFSTKIIRYQQSYKRLHVSVTLIGTSNSTSLTFTLPAALSSGSCTGYGFGQNNGTGNVKFYSASGTTVTVNNDLNGSGTAWTASGTKYFTANFFFETA